MKDKKLDSYYTKDFYENKVSGPKSSKNILSYLYKLYIPNSVIDFGCGRGTWLSVAESLGSKFLKGLDGTWIKKEDLQNKNIDFTPIDFEKDFDVDEKYDLCISLEVAEHISEKRAEYFVQRLCLASDIVLFSAAIKNQGGINHINEQNQSYWIEMFQKCGFECFDIFRNKFWRSNEVVWYYAQNTFLFIKKTNAQIPFEKLWKMEKTIPDIVHPRRLENIMKISKNPSLKNCLGFLTRYFINKLKLFFRALS